MSVLSLDLSELEESLPERTCFPEAMPRYPNLWFAVDERLARRGRYRYAVELVVKLLEQKLGMKDDFVTGIENAFAYRYLATPTEGADFQMRTGLMHAYTDQLDTALSHRHQVHLRFYVTALQEQALHAVRLRALADGKVLLVPASVHYEVATEDPAHPYVDSCPLCGITGEYEMEIDRTSQQYCLEIHDPLGVEYLLHGTIRGQRREAMSDAAPTPLEECSGDSGATMAWMCRTASIKAESLEPKRLGIVYVAPT